MHPSFSRRRALAATHGGLLGAWWGLCFVLLIRGTDHAWWLTSLTPAQLDRAFGFEFMMLPVIAKRAGIALLPTLPTIAFGCLLIGALAGYLTSALAQLLRIDPEQKSRQSVLDVMRSSSFLFIMLGAPVAVTLLVAALVSLDAMIFAAFLIWFMAPFLVLDRSRLSAQGPLRAGTWSWPGARPFATCLALWLLAWIVSTSLEFGSAFVGTWAWLLAQVPDLLVGTGVSLLSCAAWIDRQPGRDLWRRRAQWLRWAPFAAFLALDLRLLVIFLWIAPPVLGWMLSGIWIFPQIREVLEQEGRPMPDWIGYLGALNAHWYLLALLFAPVLLAVHGRLYVRLFPQSMVSGPSSV